MHGLIRSVSAALTAAVAVAALAACGSSDDDKSSSGSGGGGKSSSAASKPPADIGTVSVLYAGSLVNMMEHDLGPKFAAADHAKYQGYGAGSKQVAMEITGKQRKGDVFISASPMVNDTLTKAGYVDWYSTFASAPLLIGYNPKSKFAADIKSKPWNEVVTEAGIRLGRTDPKLDPKGKLTEQAFQMENASSAGFAAKADKAVAVYPEETLVGRLQSGQLDAGFFYANEAKEQKIPTVPLGSIKLSATYTVTTLNHAKNSAGGAAFVKFLLGSQGKAILAAHGITVLPAKLSGKSSAVPSALTSLVGG